MKPVLSNDISALIASLFNYSLAATFLLALLNPDMSISIVFGLGMLIFFVEFLSLHSSAMLGGKKPKMPFRILYSIIYEFPILTIYIAIIAALGLIFGYWQLLLFFAASLFGKILVPMENWQKMGSQFLFFILSAIFIIAFAPSLADLFPFSPDVLAQKMPGSGGLFVEYPQAVLIWGILYYGVLALLDTRIMFKIFIKKH
jgi:hypothetical protein